MQLPRSTGWETWLGTILLAMIGGIVATAPSSPPASRRADSGVTPVVTEEKASAASVYARTSEDPLLAVSQLPVGEPPADTGPCLCGARTPERCVRFATWPDPEDSLGALRRRLADAPSVQIIMQEMLAGPGLEDEESRRQERLATSYALAQAGFTPLDAQRLGAIPLASHAAPGAGRRLAWQLFSRPNQLCLVVFTPDPLFDSDDALARAECVAIQLLEDRAKPPDAKPAELLVLRRTSDGLIRDLACAAMYRPRDPSFLRTTVLNTGSTINTDALADLAGQAVRRRLADTRGYQPDYNDGTGAASFEDRVRQVRYHLDRRESGSSTGTGTLLSDCNGWRIGRVLASDQRLIACLQSELELRRRWTDDPSNAIAVLYEGGTSYGQSFAQSFAIRGADPSRIRTLAFEAGLDLAPRSMPGRAAFSALRDEAKRLADAGMPTGPTTPLGMRQIDYVYRHLQEYQRQLGTQSRRLAAVVICAIDIADKRPLIQLIRERFPDALVLTTDLHAALTDPADYAVMRNLVVASHLGLRAGDVLQGDYAPFRSSYQTALFLGIQAALPLALDADGRSVDQPYANAVGEVRAAAPPAHVFEIGRTGAVPLGAPSGAGAYASAAPSPPVLVSAARLVSRAADAMRRAAPEVPPLAMEVISITLLGAIIIAAVGLAAGCGGPVPYATLLVLGVALGPVLYIRRAGTFPAMPGWLPNGIVLAAVGVGAVVVSSASGRPRRTWFLITGVVGALAVAAAPNVVGSKTGSWTWASIDPYLFAAIGLVGLVALATLSHSILAGEVDEFEVEPTAPAAQVDAPHSRARALARSIGRLLDPAGADRAPATGAWDRVHARGGRWLIVPPVAVLAGFAIVAIGSGASGEPWGVLDGVSAWPAEILRVLALVAGVVAGQACIRTQRTLWRAAAGLDDRELFPPISRAGLARARELERTLLECPPELPGSPGDTCWTRRLRTMSIVDWRVPVADGHLYITGLLRQFRHRCGLESCATRLLLLALPFVAVIIGALGVLYVPPVPLRGSATYAVHVALMTALALVLNAVVLVLWDCGHLCNRYVGHLARHRSRWPEPYRTAALEITGVSTGFVDSWLDVRSIARVTTLVNRLIYFPVAIILLSALAWHARIDDWSFSLLFVVLYGLSLSVCVLAAFSLRRSAERARNGEVLRLERELAVLDRQDEDHYLLLAPPPPAAAATTTPAPADTPSAPATAPHDLTVELKFGPNRAKLYIESLRVLPGAGGTPVPPDSVVGVEPRAALALAGALASPSADDAPHALAPNGDRAPRAHPSVASVSAFRDRTVRIGFRRARDGQVVHAQLADLTGPAALEPAQLADLAAALTAAATAESRIRAREKTRDAQRAQIRSVIDQIRAIREGAFAPWTDDPVFRGVALPLIGFLSVSFAEWINNAVQNFRP